MVALGNAFGAVGVDFEYEGGCLVGDVLGGGFHIKAEGGFPFEDRGPFMLDFHIPFFVLELGDGHGDVLEITRGGIL